MPNDGEVVGGKAGTHRGLVLVEVDVEAPMKSVLDLPMTAYRLRDAPGVGGKEADVAATLMARGTPEGPLSLNDGEALQIRPLFGLVKPLDRVKRPAATYFGTAMAALSAFGLGDWRPCAPHPRLGEQEGLDELGMVVLHTEHIVRTALTNRAGDRCLGPHRVDGDNAALQCQRCQQLRNCGDLIGFLRRGGLAQYKAYVGGKGTDKMQGARLGLGCAAPTAHSVNGDHRIGIERRHKLADPAPKRGFKLVRIEGREYAPESVMGGNSVFKDQKASQPVDPLFGPGLDVGELVGAAQNCAHRDGQQLGQIVPDLACAARVGNRDKHLRERHYFPRRHGRPKRRENYTNSGAVNSGVVSV